MSWTRALIFWPMLAGSIVAAGEGSGTESSYFHGDVAPALRAVANRDHVPLARFDLPDAVPRMGDATTVWVRASDRGASRQWLIQFKRAAATWAEQAAARRKGVKKKYLSWGPVVTFQSKLEALELWIAGPIDEEASASSEAPVGIKRRRLLMPADYLRLGLDNSLRVDEFLRRRVRELTQQDPTFRVHHLYSLEEPVDPQEMALARPIAEKIGYTPEMERAWCGGFVALQAFYRMVNEVPEFESMAAVAVEKPSVWKLAKLATGTRLNTNIGGPATQAVNPAEMGLLPVRATTYQAPFSFMFGKDRVVCGRLVVSAPLPPLDTTAGVLALVASHPSDAARNVQVVVLACERGGGER